MRRIIRGAKTTIVARRLFTALVAAFVVVVLGCASEPPQPDPTAQGSVSADKLLPVDCLLPAQIRKLGTQVNYLAARRAIKTTALDCEIRGGEYVAYDRADYKTALTVWLDKAKAGDPEAQTYVGEIYEKGLGLPADFVTAYKWYSQAAEQGYSRAQINLGYLYEKGLGVEKDTVTALNWYRRASGVTDNDIDYNSTIEVKAANLAQEQTQLLRQEIKRREKEIGDLKKSLNEAQQQLKEREQSLQESQQKLKQLKLELDQGQTDQSRLNELQQAYQRQIQKVEQVQSAITVLQSVVARRQSLVNLQNNNVQAQKQQLAAANVPGLPASATAGPTIEVYDPIILITRSGEPTVRVRAGSKAQVVRGKITAPAGLKRATMNERALTTDSAGIFHSAVSVESGRTRVSIEAVDALDQSANLSFMLEPKQEMIAGTGDNTSVNRVAKSIDFGKYYALIIGNNEYRNYPPLDTAINDAKTVESVLKSKYGFDTRLITNADRYTILSALNEVKAKMNENDNLLIYYAGHGERDPATLQGYWLPVDAEQENTANWIPNSAISDLLNTMKARHILVVADSCYSGSMTRSSVARLNTELDDAQLKKWLKVMAKTNSRTVLTSGGVQPVLDSGGGKHSIFAKAFLNELENGDKVLDAYKIYLNVAGKVSSDAEAVGFDQTPTYAPIQHTGHSGGEFIFVSS